MGLKAIKKYQENLFYETKPYFSRQEYAGNNIPRKPTMSDLQDDNENSYNESALITWDLRNNGSSKTSIYQL